jgi:DNA processing protein
VELAADPTSPHGLQLGRPGMLQEQSSPPAPAVPPGREDPAQAERILELLGPSPTAIDALVRQSHLPASQVMAALLMLEVAGRVEMLPGNMVALLAEAAH